MIYSHEVEMMCPVAQGANHGPAPIPEEAKWVKAKEVKDISGLTPDHSSDRHVPAIREICCIRREKAVHSGSLYFHTHTE